MRELPNLLLASDAETDNEYSPHKDETGFSPFLWLHLVCLDAPFVAITWQWFFARSFHLSLTASLRAALFLTAWLIYLADRLADTWTLRENDPRSLRQKFCQRHQRAGVVVIAGIALSDSWLIVHQLDRRTIEVGILIGGISLVYLAFNYWLGKIWRFVPIKEISVGTLFACGTVVVLFPRIDLSAGFIVAFLLYATLCSLNCISIAVWEREIDRAQDKDSIATRWHGIRFCLRPVAFVLAVFAIALALGTKVSMQVCLCIGISAALLGTLDWLGETITRDERTALADLVLLTPLFLLA